MSPELRHMLSLIDKARTNGQTRLSLVVLAGLVLDVLGMQCFGLVDRCLIDDVIARLCSPGSIGPGT
jgi:hypothetical protein